MQHHADHWPARSLLAVRRTLLGPNHKALTLQMQLGHGVAQHVVMPLGQLLVEMLHREAAVKITIQTQHSLDLRNRSPPQRWRQTPIIQARWPSLSMPIPPAAERPFADPKQFSRLHLAQLRALRT